MTPRYGIRMLVLSSGERLPALLNVVECEPLDQPTLYVIYELRARNLASNTIDQALRAIMILQLFLDARGIDLDSRLFAGELFEFGELEELIRLCRLPMSDIPSVLEASRSNQGKSRPNLSMENCRMRQRESRSGVDPQTSANRARAIRDYIRWRVAYRLSKHDLDQQTFTALESTAIRVCEAFTSRIRSSRRRSTIDGREGAPPGTIERLMGMIG
ncbi:hypothetical protein RBA09_08700, partial [Massilia sp. CCM 9029]|nr:hypothetical protein [Massilia sp. CCM 9029]